MGESTSSPGAGTLDKGASVSPLLQDRDVVERGERAQDTRASRDVGSLEARVLGSAGPFMPPARYQPAEGRETGPVDRGKGGSSLTLPLLQDRAGARRGSDHRKGGRHQGLLPGDVRARRD